MKNFMIFMTLCFSTLTMAKGPECTLVKNGVEKTTLGFNLIQDERADIPGWRLDYKNADLDLLVTNADGHYFAVVETKDMVLDHMTVDEDLVLEFTVFENHYLLNCPSYIF